MQYSLIGFHSVGKTLEFNLPDSAIFSGLADKENINFIPVFCIL